MNGRKIRKNAIRILLPILLLICLCLGLAGCGGKQTAPEASPAAASSAETEAEMPEESSANSEEADTEEAEAAELSEETEGPAETAESDGSGEILVTEDGTYTGKEEVAAYIHEFGHLPDNYITKREAEDLGWVSREGNLWEVAPGKSIGGSKFGNYEGLLPEASGRKYYECDIDFDGTYRNAKRIIYSDDGLIFYTEDHYETFEQLY